MPELITPIFCDSDDACRYARALASEDALDTMHYVVPVVTGWIVVDEARWRYMLAEGAKWGITYTYDDVAFTDGTLLSELPCTPPGFNLATGLYEEGDHDERESED